MRCNPSISVTAVVLTNDDGRVALVRKYDTAYFIFPGGKPELGETGVDAGVREVHEELGVVLDATALEYLGDYVTPAANEAHTELFSQVYRTLLPADCRVRVQAEIAELIWVDPCAIELPADTDLAPLSRLILAATA